MIRAWTPPAIPTATPATLIKKAPTLPVQPVTDTDESCRKSWVVQPTEEYLETAVVVLFPFALYGFGRVLVWIRNGFRTGTAGSN